MYKHFRIFILITKLIIIIAGCDKKEEEKIHIIIRTSEELDAVRNNLSAHYTLGNSIELTDYLAYGGAGYVKWSTSGWKSLGGIFTGTLFFFNIQYHEPEYTPKNSFCVINNRYLYRFNIYLIHFENVECNRLKINIQQRIAACSCLSNVPLTLWWGYYVKNKLVNAVSDGVEWLVGRNRRGTLDRQTRK